MSIGLKKGKLNIRILLPIVHFLLTFFFERVVLIADRASEVAFSVALSDKFSLGFEQALCYAISKLMAAVIIIAAWNMVFLVVDKKIKKQTVILFAIIWVVSIALSLLQWPEDFLCGGDNYIPFAYSLRLVPEYWHSIYLSCLYTACYMVFPHVASITVFQCSIFVFAIAYVYNRIDESECFEKCRFIKYFTLVMFVFRDSFGVSTNPERAEFNTSFLLLFVGMTVMDMMEKKKRPLWQYLLLTVFAAFLAVFRSEGIIVGLLLLISLLFVNYRPGIKKGVLGLVLLFVCFFIFSLPTKVGEIKYYGNDYSVMNTFSSLQNILNSEDGNINYEGAEDDLASLDALVPIEILKEYGADGYRRLNYAAGHADINQSMADSEVSGAYMSAYYSLVLHNLPIYLKTQGFMLLNAIGTGVSEYSVEYTGEHTELEDFGHELWEVGVYDALEIPGRYVWTNNAIRNKLTDICAVIRMGYMNLLIRSYIYAGFIVAEFVLSVYLVLSLFVGLFKKKFEDIGIMLAAIILDGYFVLISLVMPVGANMYFHAYIYCMYFVLLTALSKRSNKTAK